MSPVPTWESLLARVRAGESLWYHAPLDRFARLVVKIRIFKSGKVRVTAGECTFTADPDHLSRFMVRS